jgi:hypothetical protein
MMLAIVSKMNMKLHQMDFVTAFLNGDLREDVYMEQPEGFVEHGMCHKFVISRILCMVPNNQRDNGTARWTVSCAVKSDFTATKQTYAYTY